MKSIKWALVIGGVVVFAIIIFSASRIPTKTPSHPTTIQHTPSHTLVIPQRFPVYKEQQVAYQLPKRFPIYNETYI